MKRLMLALSTMSFAAFAADIQVTETVKAVLDTGDSVSPSAAAIPDSLPGSATPLFRFDASARTGWEFDAGDATKITKIPSLNGTRFLTTTLTGGDWTANWPNPPSLVTDPTLGGGRPCVDFGAAGSKLGFLFNAATGGAGVENRLYNIGTVIVVLNSENGGGTLLGGGTGPNNGGTNTGFYFRRGLAAATPSSAWDPLDCSATVFRWYGGAVGDVAAKVAALGTVYLDGRPVATAHHGLSGGWNVVSLQPTEASLNAHGVGIGAIGGTYASNFSGGQRIAELVIYDQVISDADRAAVESYLQHKWFGRDPRGCGDNAVVDTVRVARNVHESYESNGAVAKAVVGPDETLTINRLFGGRGGWSSFNVSGGGTLKLGTASEFQGTVRSHGAKLAFDRRVTPSALPAGAIAHFDAADADSIHENGTGVYQWDSQSDFQLNGHRLALYYESDHAAQVPKTTETGPGGRKAIDFWCTTGDATSGAYLKLVYADTLAAAKAQGVSTLVAVIRPYKFGHYLCGPFDGADPGGATALSYFNPSAYNSAWNQSLFNANANTSKHPTLTGANANRMWTDGLRHDHTTGYAHNGWQVVAIQGPGSQFGALGAGAHYYYAGGGFEIVEIAYYCRALSEDEILDAQAYLSSRWMGRETAGYQRNAERAKVDDIATLEVVGPTEISVAAGDTVRIGRLSCDARLRKTGAGTLEVKTLLNGAANLVVEEGRVVKAALSTPADNLTPAKDPAAWFDSSDAKYFEFKNDTADTSFTKAINRWYDRTGRISAYHNGGHPAWYDETTDVLNGRPIVSFGTLGGSAYRFLRFNKPIDGIKAAFVVWGSQEGGGCMLGQYNTPGYENNRMQDFNRTSPYVTTSSIIEQSAHTQHVWGGDIYVNGSRVAIADAKLSGGWDLVEVYPAGAGHASALAYQYGDSSVGRTRLAEVILYERELTEKEKVATRNYLLAKWGLGSAQAEPDEPANPADVEYASLKNGEDYLKDGAGTLALADVNGYTGRVTVAAGTLALTGRPAPEAAPLMATDGLIAQFDATSGIVPGTDVRGRPCVNEWVAKTGSYKAVADTKGFPPTYAAAGLNGRPTVNLTEGTWNHWMFMHFTDLSGNRAEITGIKTVLWVIGSQEGGGFLLGGGHNPRPGREAQHYSFHRGGTAGRSAADPLLAGAAQDDLQTADWRVNGNAVTAASTGLSGGWDIVSVALKSTAEYAPSAEGFAFDGRFDPENGEWNYDSRSGFQRLAEVLIYNRVLTAEEIAATEAYLAAKWGIDNQSAELNGLSVELAAGTTLDPGEAGYVASVTGEGTVDGDISVGTLVADYAAPNTGLAVNGTLKIAAHQVIRVANAPLVPGVATLVIATAAEYEGLGNLAGVVVTGLPEGTRTLAKIMDGKIVLKIGCAGTMVLFR